jgi:hypothetical protein
MNTEERLARLEQRIEAIEKIIADTQARMAAFAAGPGRRILAALGVRL